MAKAVVLSVDRGGGRNPVDQFRPPLSIIDFTIPPPRKIAPRPQATCYHATKICVAATNSVEKQSIVLKEGMLI